MKIHKIQIDTRSDTRGNMTQGQRTTTSIMRIENLRDGTEVETNEIRDIVGMKGIVVQTNLIAENHVEKKDIRRTEGIPVAYSRET